MPTKALACTECHMIIDVQTGNLGWWLKSNNELKAKNKKALAILAFTTKNGRKPDEKERKAWEKENKDDFERIKAVEPRCSRCPDAHLSADWQGLTILLEPNRSEVARTLGIDAPGNYALKVRHQ